MPEPIWRQIAEDLRQKIESGLLGRDGRPLPTELELREQYRASRNTIRDAVKWLSTRGLVETRPGQGTFVVQMIDPFVTPLDIDTGFGDDGVAYYASAGSAHQQAARVSAPRVEIHQAAGMVAAELRLEAGSPVVSRHQQRYIDGVLWSLQTTWYPMRLVDRGAHQLIQAEDMPGGVVRYLRDVLGIKQAGFRDKITVRAPDATESASFGLPDDGRVPVLEVRRTAFDESGGPFRVTVTTYPTDRNEFMMTVGDVPSEESMQPGPRPADGQAKTPKVRRPEGSKVTSLGPVHMGII